MFLSKRKFKNEKGKEFTQVALNTMTAKEDHHVGRVFALDLNWLFIPRLRTFVYKWGTLEDRTFLCFQLLTMKITDLKSFQGKENEVLDETEFSWRKKR